MTKITINDLGKMIKDGFDGQDKKFEQAAGERKGLKQGQEKIELRLSNVAYRFELQELQQRVIILEKKMKVKTKK